MFSNFRIMFLLKSLDFFCEKVKILFLAENVDFLIKFYKNFHENL